MKKILFLFFSIGSLNSFAQSKYQFSLGAGQSFLQSVNMKTGNIGLNFKQDKNVFIDVNKNISNTYKLALGVHLKLNLSSDLFELNKSVPYYSAKKHIPIYMVESAEANIYIKKYFMIYKSGNNTINLFTSIGPTFNFNEGNSYHSVYSLRDDDRDKSFQVSFIDEKAQKGYVPYVRITGGFEIFKKIGRQYYLGLNPFITWAGLQSENNHLTVLPDDATYISTGSFKRNRSGYGVRLIFSK